MRRSSLRRVDQPSAGKCLTPEPFETPDNVEIQIALSKSDIIEFESNVSNVNMDSTMLAEIARSVKSLEDRMTVGQSIDKTFTFDGSSADAFTKWLRMMDDIFDSVDQNDNKTTYAASKTLKGTALDFFRDTKRQVSTWPQIREAMTARYAYLNPVTRSKQKIRTALQRTNETISDFAERLRTLAEQAYADRHEEKEVIETLTIAFINGLRDRRLQESIARKMPTSLGEAYKLALHEQQVRDHLSMFKDNSNIPEPMDCDVVSGDKGKDKEDKVQRQLEQVTETLGSICQVLMAQQPTPPTPQTPQNPRFQVQPQGQQYYRPQQQTPYRGMQSRSFQQSRNNGPPRNGNPRHDTRNHDPGANNGNSPRQVYRWTEDDRPICHFCGTAGHVQRQCRKRREQNNPQRSGN